MRRTLARLALPSLLLALAACGSSGGTGTAPPTPPGPGDLWDGFEAGLEPWERDADVPPSPEDPTVPVSWSIERVASPVHAGAASVRLVLDGRQDDGTIWLERRLAVEADRAWRVTVSAWWWSESESFNTTALVALHAGASSPELESDFAFPGPLNLVAGWRRYEAGFDVTSAPDGSLWVAVGLSVVWETWITYYLDDVEVWLEPR